jgi:hypothetical protein
VVVVEVLHSVPAVLVALVVLDQHLLHLLYFQQAVVSAEVLVKAAVQELAEQVVVLVVQVV